MLALFGWQQRAHRDREPLIPAGIFADRNFAVMCAVVAAISLACWDCSCQWSSSFSRCCR